MKGSSGERRGLRLRGPKGGVAYASLFCVQVTVQQQWRQGSNQWEREGVRIRLRVLCCGIVGERQWRQGQGGVGEANVYISYVAGALPSPFLLLPFVGTV